MSCKVIRSTDGPSAPPLFESSRPAGSRVPAQWHPEAAKDAPEPPEILRLRRELAELRRSLPERLQQAHDAGHREGESAGFTRAEETGRPVFEKLASSIAEIAKLRTKLRNETEKDLVTLALAIAKRILHREISLDPMAIQGIVRAALEKVQTREITEVRIYPGHEEVIRRCLSAIHATGIEVICDPALQPGDLTVATRRGDLQASIDTQLSEIERGLTDRISR
jgi:flagellar assembly protein FliH